MKDFKIELNKQQMIAFGYKPKRKQRGLFIKEEEGQYHAIYSWKEKAMYIHYDYFGKKGHIVLNSNFKLDKERKRLFALKKKNSVIITKPIIAGVYFKREDSPVLYKKISKKQKATNKYTQKIYQ